MNENQQDELLADLALEQTETIKEEYMKEDIFDYLMGRAEYAIKSKSLALTHETYGQAKIARKLLAITKEQFLELNKILVRNGINNPAAGLE